jgi:hypothetical protein
VPRIRQGYPAESRGRFALPGEPPTAGWTRDQHRRYFVFTDKTGGKHRMEFPTLLPNPAPRAWGQQEARRLIALLIQARGQIQAPAVYIAEQMGVAPEIIYRLEATDRDIKLSSALRYAKAIGLEFQIVETPT